MNSPISPLPPSSAHSLFHSRSPWSALLSPTPNKPRFNPTALASLIRNRATNHPISPLSPHSPHSLPQPPPGEDLNNFVWDVDGSTSAALSKASEHELYQIARLYLPSPRSRPRPPPPSMPSPNSPLARGAYPCHDPSLSSSAPLSSSSAGAFKTSLNRWLRKRTVAHLKQASQSSSSTSCPSDHSADPDGADPDSDLELEHRTQNSDEDDEAGDETHLYSQLPPAFHDPNSSLAVPSTPVFQTPSDGCFPSVPTFHHQLHAGDDEDRSTLERIPIRSSSILRC